MAKKGILFNTDMVKAILDGRKTVTRRLVMPQPPDWIERFGYTVFTPKGYISGRGYWQGVPGDEGPGEKFFKQPYQPGDILYVRETWCKNGETYLYRAGCPHLQDNMYIKWRPSIHMPREAARIFLRVTGVRVERLQEILCGDMMREGCIPPTVKGGQYQQWQRDYWIPLWDGIYSAKGYSWEQNPWVWVIEFERVEKP